MNEQNKTSENTLISDTYREMNSALHSDPDYGRQGANRARPTADLLKATGLKTVLDYGSGKGSFGAEMQKIAPTVTVVNYDPAIPQWAEDPPVCDVVLCNDVLEHVEPDNIDGVLAHLASKVRHIALLSIADHEAQKTLPDGRNAHLLVKPQEWWIEKLENVLSIDQKLVHNRHYLFTCTPKR